MTIDPAVLVTALRAYGVGRVTGVPCGHLAGPWELFERAGRLEPAADEGAALAIAAGWELAGTTAAVLCQNSGFGNLVNPLTSLLLPYHIPVLLLMSLRGWPDPATDERQHAVMGAATERMLDTIGVPYGVLAADPGNGLTGSTGRTLPDLLAEAGKARAAGLPYAVLVPRGTIGAIPRGGGRIAADAAGLTRAEVVRALLGRLTDEVLVTTTGYLSRQAYHERDRPRTFYMQGSMGHAAAIGLGLAIERPDERVVVLDGDGAFLMHLGTGSTIGSVRPANLLHVVVDNGCYESTGGQRSTSAGLAWPALGTGLGYARVVEVRQSAELDAALCDGLRLPGPSLCVLHVAPTPDEVHPRASASVSLTTVAHRFSAAVASGGPGASQ
jgi:phosphonopyruvate decarboxylase